MSRNRQRSNSRASLGRSNLAALYYNPKTGYLGQNKLSEKSGCAPHLVKKFLEEQPVYQVSRRSSSGVRTKPTQIQAPIGSYQIDLAFIPQYKSKNDGHDTILTCIGINNRYGLAVPLKNKSTKAAVEAITKLILAIRSLGPLIRFQSDKGSEFTNKKVKDLLLRENIELVLSHAKNEQGLVERFNRTLKSFLSKYFIHTNNTRWIDVLDDFVYNYNHTLHSAIHMRPIDAISNVNEERRIFLEKIHDTDFNLPRTVHVGDTVRVKVKRSKFAKEGQNWSSDTYIVEKVLPKSIVLTNGKRFLNASVLVVPSETNTRTTRNQARKVRDRTGVENKYKADRMARRLMN